MEQFVKLIPLYLFVLIFAMVCNIRIAYSWVKTQVKIQVDNVKDNNEVS